jgi:hypothetical protein
MSLEVYYGSEIRRNLSYFAAWLPGEAISPGDVGIVKNGLFNRETSLKALFPDLSFDVVPNDAPHPSHFFSKNCVVGKLKAKGKAVGQGKASLTIDFNAKGGVVFDASDCTSEYIKDILAVRQFIGRHRTAWPAGMVLVTHVEKSTRFKILISEAQGAKVELTGDIGPLEQVRIADASVAVSASEGLGFQRTGEGPVALRLYGFKWWSSQPHLLDADNTAAEDEAFGEISARDPYFDADPSAEP